MPNPTSRPNADKPEKPTADFPLFAHASGQWAKKICGSMVYFGKWDDPQAALAEYNKNRESLHDGLGKNDGKSGATVKDLVNQFLTSRREDVKQGVLSPLTFRDYYDTGVRMSKVLKRSRPLSKLLPAHFDRYKSMIAKTRGPTAVGNEVNRVRIICNWAFEYGLVDKPIRFGPAFRRPSKLIMRREQAKRDDQIFEVDELHTLLEASSVPMKAMILLGLNCGLGNTDVADLDRKRHLDLSGEWLNYPRPKTGIPRRCKLWPKTVEAIKAAIAIRPKPAKPADAGCVFLTARGVRYVVVNERTKKGAVRTDSVRWEFRELLNMTGLKREGLGFYTLRHCFETIGGECRDQVAVDICMGHVDPGMGATYRRRRRGKKSVVSDERLADVAKVVHEWLWPSEQPATIPISQAAVS